MTTVFNNPYTDEVLTIPTDVTPDGHKIATCKDKYLRNIPLVLPAFTGTKGASISESNSAMHRIIGLPMVAGPQTYTLPLTSFTKNSAGIIPIPPGTVQMTVSCRFLMLAGKTTADYGFDSPTEWNFRIVSLQEIPESDVLIVNSTNAFNATGLGGVANPANVAHKIEATSLAAPYAMFKGIEDVSDMLINVHPGMSYVLPQLISSNLPMGITGTLQVVMGFLKQAYIKPFTVQADPFDNIQFTANADTFVY